jgi:hypothetical protein
MQTKKMAAAGALGGVVAMVLFALMGPRDGNGTYTLPAGNPVVVGTPISATTHNTTMSDIATALSNSLAKDGQTTATANLPMGGFRHTNVDDADARTDYAAAGQVQDGDLTTLGSVSGTNTITATLTPAIAAYVAGMRMMLTPANTNTGATTLAVNGLTALDVLTNEGLPLAPGDLPAGSTVELIVDSGADDFILINPRTSRIITKATDTSRVSTTTVSADPTLAVSLVSGQTYAFRFEIFATGPDAIDYILTKPSATFGWYKARHQVVNGSASESLNRAYEGSTWTTSEQSVSFVSASTPVLIILEGVIKPSADGVLSFDWGPSLSSLGGTIVKTGSYVEFRRIG